MRALATQVRLRRLIRVHGEYMERLAASPSDGELALMARARLRQLTDDVRRAWLSDLARADADGVAVAERPVVERHVERGLRAIESVVAEEARPAGDREWLRERFKDAAVPLALFLYGLEEAPAELVGEWLAPRHLAESA
jgi:hypothetical protein